METSTCFPVRSLTGVPSGLAVVYYGDEGGFCVAVRVAEFGGGVNREDCHAGGVMCGCRRGWGGWSGAGFAGSWVVAVVVGGAGAEAAIIVPIRALGGHGGVGILVPWDGYQ